MTKAATPANAKKATKPAAFYRAETYDPEESVGYLMKQILSEVGLQIDQHLTHTELTNAQWRPLYKLFAGHASTVAELARECQMDAGAMTRTLDRLEAKGLCQRVRSEQDRRVVNIALTDTGGLAAAEIPHVLSQVQNATLQGFSAEEFETLKNYLRRILTNAKAMQGIATSPDGTSDAS